jgi:lactoylglutathione lyase
MASRLFPTLSCADLERSLAFYGEVLGGVERYRFPEEGERPSSRWASAGGEQVAPPADMPWGEPVAWVADPDGNLVMLTMQAPGPGPG